MEGQEKPKTGVENSAESTQGDAGVVGNAGSLIKKIVDLTQRMIWQQEKVEDAIVSGDVKRMEQLKTKILDDIKPLEEEHKKAVNGFQDDFDRKIEAMRSDSWGGIKEGLENMAMTIKVSGFDDYLIEDCPLEESKRNFFNSSALIIRMVGVATKEGVVLKSTSMLWSVYYNDIRYLGGKLIERIKNDGGSEEDIKKIQEVIDSVKE